MPDAPDDLDTDANRSVRPGGEAAGGVTPHPGDPTHPEEDAERAQADDDAMRQRGFGDHKGASIDK